MPAPLPTPREGERLPHRLSDPLLYNALSFLVPGALVVALLIAVGLDDLWLSAGALAALGLGAVLAWADVRSVRDNWVRIGSETSTLCIKGHVTEIRNRDVSQARWVRGDVLDSTVSSPTLLELTVDGEQFRVELLFGLLSHRRRALRRANDAFSNASWTYDPNRLFGLWPSRTWGPGNR